MTEWAAANCPALTNLLPPFNHDQHYEEDPRDGQTDKDTRRTRPHGNSHACERRWPIGNADSREGVHAAGQRCLTGFASCCPTACVARRHRRPLDTAYYRSPERHLRVGRDTRSRCRAAPRPAGSINVYRGCALPPRSGLRPADRASIETHQSAGAIRLCSFTDATLLLRLSTFFFRRSLRIARISTQPPRRPTRCGESPCELRCRTAHPRTQCYLTPRARSNSMIARYASGGGTSSKAPANPRSAEFMALVVSAPRSTNIRMMRSWRWMTAAVSGVLP